MTLRVLEGGFTVCKLRNLSGVSLDMEFCFFARTDDELSLVCRSENTPANCVQVEDGWRMLRIEGQLDFSLTGILAGLSRVLAEAQIGIFAISTYDTDYILVKETALNAGVHALRRAGYTVQT